MEAAMSGHNSALTDEDLRALGFHHLGHYKQSLAAKKASDAAFKNTCKRALADGISVDRIKLMIRLEEEGGEEALRDELNEKLATARWMGAEVGKQFDFLDEPDRTPLEDRAFEWGKIAGYKGEALRTPEGYSGEVEQAFARGYHEGQQTLMSALEITKAAFEESEAEEAAARVAAQVNGGEPRKRGRPKGGKNAKGGKSFTEQLKPHLAEGDAATGAQQ